MVCGLWMETLMAPNLFRNGQLYVLMSQANSGVVTPEVFALLQRKTQVSYEYLFSTISEHCLRLGFLANPRNIMIDFEYSIMRAIQSIFGIGVIVKGCFFHLCQSTYRKLQGLGLVREYDSNADFKHFCGKIDSLAFLPLDDVFRGMAHI